MEAVMDGSLLSSISDVESAPKESALSLDLHHQDTSLLSGLDEEQQQEEDDEEEVHKEEEEEEVEEEEKEEEEVQGERLLSAEEQVTLITDSMSITSADEEKLQLLNRNMELRRINKELMRLNEDWDQVYRSTSLGLQQRVETMESQLSSIRQLNSKLLLKVEHEQNKREYYEQTLMEELKKNHHLQEYVQLLEGRLQHTHTLTDWSLPTQSIMNVSRPPDTKSDSMSANQKKAAAHRNGPQHTSPPQSPSEPRRSAGGGSSGSSGGGGGGGGSSHAKTHKHNSSTGRKHSAHTLAEVQDLKDQLEALKCQTKLYEADYRIEHKDHERMLQENKRLRRREGEMRQQMALLQEQLKVYEDDFQRERSDKQVLQRLLMKKTSPPAEGALVHRCNASSANSSSSSRQREHGHANANANVHEREHERERQRSRDERRRKKEALRLHHDLHHHHHHCDRHQAARDDF